MKSKLCIIIGSFIITISLLLIINDKFTEYKAGINSKEILTIINEIESSNKNKALEKVTIKGHNYIGTITIPSLNISLPVLDTWNDNNLKIAPSLYYGSSIDKIIICAHSYKTHFKNIGKLKQNDYIIFKTIDDNEFIYKVEEVEILSQTDVDKMINNNFNLTLYTCTKDGTKRITVRCNLINLPF